MMAFVIENEIVSSSTITDQGIYNNDPLEQRKLLNNVIEVTRADGHKVIGTVFTIDPVSESIVLVTNTDGKPSMDIVMGHAVQSVSMLPDVKPISLESLFPSSNPASSMTAATITALRNKLKSWLIKNYLPVEEEGDVLKLHNALRIYPPYTSDQCVSDNEIILGKVQTLILSMPQHDL